MKKSIFYFGIALLGFSNFANAAHLKNPNAPKSLICQSLKSNPLHIAIQKGEIDLVRKMVEYGSDVNEFSGGMTPLMIAARYNKVEIIKFLLAHGAHVSIKDEKGFNALRYAELSMASESVAILKQS